MHARLRIRQPRQRRRRRRKRRFAHRQGQPGTWTRKEGARLALEANNDDRFLARSTTHRTAEGKSWKTRQDHGVGIWNLALGNVPTEPNVIYLRCGLHFGNPVMVLLNSSLGFMLQTAARMSLGVCGNQRTCLQDPRNQSRGWLGGRLRIA